MSQQCSLNNETLPMSLGNTSLIYLTFPSLEVTTVVSLVSIIPMHSYVVLSHKYSSLIIHSFVFHDFKLYISSQTCVFSQCYVCENLVWSYME